MTRDEVRHSFIELIRPFVKGFDLKSVSDTTSLTNDLKINSTRFVDIVLDAEDKFGVQIDNEAMNRLDTVGGAVDMILEKMSAVK